MFGNSIFGSISGSGSGANTYEYGVSGGLRADGSASIGFVRAERETLEEALKDYLLTQSEITDRVSTRVYPFRRPQKSTLPALVVSLSDTDSATSLYAGVGVLRTQIIVEAYSNDFQQASRLGELLRVCLDGQKGQWGSIEVLRVRHQGVSSDYLENPTGADKGLYLVAVNFMIKYRAELPLAAASIP